MLAAERKTHHVVRDLKGGWRVIRGGAQRASKHFDTQAEAVAWGRELSRNQGSELYIHRQDGTIQSKDSYGRDAASARSGRARARS
jgi:hypothetical protein